MVVSVDRLIGRYRAGGAASAPILASAMDVLAYANYRMPATLAACRNVLWHSASRIGEVTSVVDLGGGTGAMAWAAAEEWPDASVTVLDQAGEAMALGRRLRSAEPGSVEFRTWQAGSPVPAADLVTISYVLSELRDADRSSIVLSAIRAATRGVVIVEPGTPDGHRRVLAARALLLEAGLRVVTPCPHQLACPIAAPDWCHFSARVERSAMHRRLKGGDLGHEDEKFSYVVAVVDGSTDLYAADGSRVIRHPMKRKGLVELQLCRPDGSAGRQIVTKKAGVAYRTARDVRWGDDWPADDRVNGG